MNKHKNLCWYYGGLIWYSTTLRGHNIKYTEIKIQNKQQQTVFYLGYERLRVCFYLFIFVLFGLCSLFFFSFFLVKCSTHQIFGWNGRLIIHVLCSLYLEELDGWNKSGVPNHLNCSVPRSAARCNPIRQNESICWSIIKSFTVGSEREP